MRGEKRRGALSCSDTTQASVSRAPRGQTNREKRGATPVLHLVLARKAGSRFTVPLTRRFSPPASTSPPPTSPFHCSFFPDVRLRPHIGTPTHDHVTPVRRRKRESCEGPSHSVCVLAPLPGRSFLLVLPPRPPLLPPCDGRVLCGGLQALDQPTDEAPPPPPSLFGGFSQAETRRGS